MPSKVSNRENLAPLGARTGWPEVGTQISAVVLAGIVTFIATRPSGVRAQFAAERPCGVMNVPRRLVEVADDRGPNHELPVFGRTGRLIDAHQVVDQPCVDVAEELVVLSSLRSRSGSPRGSWRPG